MEAVSSSKNFREIRNNPKSRTMGVILALRQHAKSDGPKELRSRLTDIHMGKYFRFEGFKNFDKFLDYCIRKSGSNLTNDYLKREAKAGYVEVLVLGTYDVGTMKERDLRPLYEHVKLGHRKRIFRIARYESRYSNPTAAKLIEVAKKCNLYHERLEED